MERSHDMFKKAIISVCTSTTVVFPDSLFPTLPTPSAMRNPGNTEEDPEPADEGNTQIEYSSDYN
jgi:hypothetical protein